MAGAAVLSMALSLTTPPTAEPLSLEEAKQYARVVIDDEDGLLEGLIVAAREYLEALTGRAFIDQVWTLTLEGFPHDGVIVLPRPPLRSVTSIAYIDAAGVTQSWVSVSGYQVQAPAGPYAERGRVKPAYGTAAPAARHDTFNAVTVVFRAGYGTGASDVPKPIKLAIGLLVRHLYDGGTLENVPSPVNALIAPYINRVTC